MSVPYIVIADVAPSDIPLEYLFEALCDDKFDPAWAPALALAKANNWAGVAADSQFLAAWAALEGSAETEINAVIEASAITLPLATPYPNAVIQACHHTVLKKCYEKRGIEKNNPWVKPAADSNDDLVKWCQKQKHFFVGSDDPIDL